MVARKERASAERALLGACLLAGMTSGLVQPASSQELSNPGAGSLIAAAYLPDYRLGAADWAGLAQYLTDVILFSVEISPRGDIEGLDRVREGLAAAKRQKQLQPKLRVLLCVGGAGRSRGFPFVSKRSDDRKTFVKKLVMLCEEQGLDGIDFDWEGGRDS